MKDFLGIVLSFILAGAVATIGIRMMFSIYSTSIEQAAGFCIVIFAAMLACLAIEGYKKDRRLKQ